MNVQKTKVKQKTAAALNWKKWAKSPFFTIQKSAALNRKKSASRFFIHKGGSLFTASLLSALLFAQCANVKGIFTDDNSTASATPPPDPITCESEAEDGGLSFAGGDGTEDTPFEVSSAEELENIGQLLYCNFRLTRNIDLSVVANWTPLGAESPCDGGNDDACFQGALDGNGKMISGLTVNITRDYGGLFGYTGEHSEIRSVGLSSVNVMAVTYVGGLVGNNGGSISNSYAAGTVSGSANSIGGLVGNNGGNISNSYATGTVSGAEFVGRLVGNNNTGSISNSYAAGTVSGSANSIGGLVGWNEGSISNSYAIGAVTAGTISCGGLAGINVESISNSYAAGEASGTSRIGGLVGWNTAGSFSGINYFADDVGGSDGLGSGPCDAAVCVQAMGSDDAARAAWLENSLDETLDSGLNWDEQLDDEGNAVWGNLNAAGFPCLKDMPAGARACP